MIPKGAFLKVVDNSGARLVQVIGTRFQYAGVGDVVKVAIKEAKAGKVATGQMKKAVITETKKPTKRLNGSEVQFMRNACILLSDKGAPLGNRVRSLLSHEFIRPRWKRLNLMCKKMF
jgi:large subunit ribosomal protein L14